VEGVGRIDVKLSREIIQTSLPDFICLVKGDEEGKR